MNENSLVIFTKASQMLAEANTIQKAKDLKDLALTAADWARRKGMGDEAVNHAKAYALEAERKIGEMLIDSKRAKGGQPHQATSPLPVPVEPTLKEIGITKNESSKAQQLASIPEEVFEQVKDGSIKRTDAQRDQKRAEIITELESIAAVEAKEIEGVYDVVVIDPPWPVKKIERDERPNQSEFDYPTMTEEEIIEQEPMCSENGHVFLWTTHKYLPMAFRVVDAWELRYIFLMTWHKPGGFQPFELAQYNSEFILYCRKGSPKFVDTKNFSTCFEAPRGKHSEKPKEFYETINRVTAGRRLEMYARTARDGWDRWGKEA